MSHPLFVKSASPYLLSHSVGLLPVSTQAYFNAHYFEPWAAGNGDIWPQWIEKTAGFRSAVARLLHVDMAQVCPQSNISSGLSKIIAALPAPHASKNVLLLSEHDFPSIGFVFQQASHYGYDLRYMPKNLDYTKPDTWSAYLTGDVAAVMITHVQSNTGVKIPFETVCGIARSRDIYSIVDVAQSVGIVPIVLGDDSNADIVLGSCVKWLCGGPGAGFVWVDKDLLERLKPLDVGWFSHQNPFEFDLHHFEYAKDALKFWGGTPSVAPFIIAEHSLSLLLDIGIDTVAQHNLKCKRYLRDHIDKALLFSPHDEARQSGTLIFRNETKYQQALDRAGVQYDSREFGIRLSPHIYTSQSDLEKVARCFQ